MNKFQNVSMSCNYWSFSTIEPSVTHEVASSSLVVPAILRGFKTLFFNAKTLYVICELYKTPELSRILLITATVVVSLCNLDRVGNNRHFLHRYNLFQRCFQLIKIYWCNFNSIRRNYFETYSLII